jgi:hypothetical protein
VSVAINADTGKLKTDLARVSDSRKDEEGNLGRCQPSLAKFCLLPDFG